VAEDYPRCVLVQVDQREAQISVVSGARRSASVVIGGDDYPRHQQQGGWSQKRYQRRADERIEAFARAVADLTRVAIEAGGIDNLIVAGDEVILPALQGAFHQTVTDRLIGTLPRAMEANFQELMDRALPLVERAERERELRAVRAVQEAAGADGPGAAGAEAVLTALQTGQVQTLVMNDDFAGPGWADYTFPLYGVGSWPGSHPAGGDVANVVSVSLPDELVRLALQSDAEIEIVRTAVPVSAEEQADVPEARGDEPHPGGNRRSEAARLLDALGGVGAVLRFALAEDQPTAEL
jgi:peptide subunit release factor 1 (eRF1)